MISTKDKYVKAYFMIAYNKYYNTKQIVTVGSKMFRLFAIVSIPKYIYPILLTVFIIVFHILTLCLLEAKKRNNLYSIKETDNGKYMKFYLSKHYKSLLITIKLCRFNKECKH